MSDLHISKVLSALPGSLASDAVYAVRVGTGFDLYITDSTGQVAYKVNSGGNLPVNAQSGAAYTAVASDASGEIRMTNAGANTVTIDANVQQADARGLIRQAGTGQTTVAVINATPMKGGPTYKTAQQGSVLTWCVAAGVVYINGECAAS
jgi:hypothetical protein